MTGKGDCAAIEKVHDAGIAQHEGVESPVSAIGLELGDRGSNHRGSGHQHGIESLQLRGYPRNERGALVQEVNVVRGTLLLAAQDPRRYPRIVPSTLGVKS